MNGRIAWVTRCILGAILMVQLNGISPAWAAPNGENALVELELRGWAPTMRGNVQSSSTGIPGTDVSLGDTLGVNTQQNFLWPKATLHFADRHRLFVSYLGMRYAGDKAITQSFTFNGTTYNVNEPVHSQIDFKEYVLGYQYDVLKFSRFALNLNLQVHYLDIETEVRSATQGSNKESFEVPIPTIGAGVQLWPTNWLKLSGDFNVFKMGIPGAKGELIDSQAALTISPVERIGLSVGYRYYRILARDTDSNDRADWLQKGPYVSLMFRF
jgi:hypothetical protein